METLGRKLKTLMGDEISALIRDNPYLFFVDFQKMPASKTEKLRRELKKSSSTLRVIKKSILKLALKKENLNDLSDLAERSSAVTFTKDDPVKTSKILFDFSKTEENMVIKGGYVDGQVLKFESVKELAMLPSREVLLAKIVGGIKSPINSLANVLRGNLQKLVYVFNAISSAKGSSLPDNRQASASGGEKEEKGG